MKTIVLVCLFAGICGMGLALRADTLYAVKITLTGQIYQGGVNPPQAISKKVLVTMFGDPSVSPATTAFFYDQTTQSYVLASKDQVTIYGTILTEAQSGGISWDATSTITMQSGNCTALNGALIGTYRERDLNGKHSSTDTIGFLVWGVANNADTVINGVFTVLFPH